MSTTTTRVIEPDPEYGPAPRALRYAAAANAAEQIIVDALPGIMRKLVSMANDGALAAARYLLDRIYGRPARLSAPAIADRDLAFTPRDWAVAKFHENKKREAFRRDLLHPEHPFEDDLFGSIAGIGRVQNPQLRTILASQSQCGNRQPKL